MQLAWLAAYVVNSLNPEVYRRQKGLQISITSELKLAYIGAYSEHILNYFHWDIPQSERRRVVIVCTFANAQNVYVWLWNNILRIIKQMKRIEISLFDTFTLCLCGQWKVWLCSAVSAIHFHLIEWDRLSLVIFTF